VKDALGAVQSVLVLGGTSEIALATVRRLVAQRTRTVVLAVRDPARAAAPAAELRALGAEVDVVTLDATAPVETHEAVVADVFARHGDLDLVLVATGVLGAPPAELMRVNATGAVASLAAAVPHLHARGHGTIIVLSSVAADRPRPKNFAYGASKAALDAYARGLADTEVASGLDVVIVRPGFVRTKMTAHLDTAPLAVDADTVATAITSALRTGAHVVYVPRTMRLVSLVLRALPRAVLRRLPI
jgi:decaprenylphospho-beta-D-erythro-pentofuranosid-2-ulose 2-reductase